MEMKYKFKEGQQAEIKAARRANRDKQIDRRLEVLKMRSEGKSQEEIAAKTGFHRSHVCNLIKKYFEEGRQAVAEKHYRGNRRNMSFEEEAEILEWFKQRAKQGQVVDIYEIGKAYQERVDHRIGHAQIYCVLE